MNMRSVTAGLTGVQRYIRELSERLEGKIRAIVPKRPLNGFRGHLWEQMALPILVRGHLLWSPANVGPLSVHRQVLTIHDLACLEHPEWFDRRFAIWYGAIIPLLVHRVARVITVSEFSRHRLLDLTHVPESHVCVIPNGVDNRFHPRSTAEINRVIERLGIRSHDYVLTVSSLEPRKNLALLLNAWQLSASRLPAEVWLVIVGAQGKKDVFQAIQVESVPPRVLFTGFVADSDLPALYSGALTLVYPSIYEGFGLPALEAMASGTVPIVAGSTSLPEVVGEAGVTIDPHRAEDFAAAIIRIVEDSGLRGELRRRAIERSREFTWDRAADLTWRTLIEAAET
jgi:glycosyltransferase involved in cell wall biosynthesis